MAPLGWVRRDDGTWGPAEPEIRWDADEPVTVGVVRVGRPPRRPKALILAGVAVAALLAGAYAVTRSPKKEPTVDVRDETTIRTTTTFEVSTTTSTVPDTTTVAVVLPPPPPSSTTTTRAPVRRRAATTTVPPTFPPGPPPTFPPATPATQPPPTDPVTTAPPPTDPVTTVPTA